MRVINVMKSFTKVSVYICLQKENPELSLDLKGVPNVMK